jgi:hypothetical protein
MLAAVAAGRFEAPKPAKRPANANTEPPPATPPRKPARAETAVVATAMPRTAAAPVAARAATVVGATRGATALATVRRMAPPPPQEEDEPEDEEFLDEDYQEEIAAAEEAARRKRSVRWESRGRFERQDTAPPRFTFQWPAWLGTQEQATIRIAAIVAGALFIVLVAIISYELGARTSRSVTLPIGVKREVSDAATAARIPNDAVKVTQTFTIFDGVDPTVFATTPDNPIAFDSTGGFARVSSSTSAPGVKVTIGPGVAARLAGQTVRVVIVARSSQESGAAGMRFAYQSGLAISHWQTANLGADYAPVGIEWRVPTMRTSPTGDFLLIEPGIPGDGTGVDVKSVRIDVIAS